MLKIQDLIEADNLLCVDFLDKLPDFEDESRRVGTDQTKSQAPEILRQDWQFGDFRLGHRGVGVAYGLAGKLSSWVDEVVDHEIGAC